MVAGTATTFASLCEGPEGVATGKLNAGTDVEYRVLGRTGLKVSALGVGSWQLSGPLDVNGKPDGYPDQGEEQVIRLIRECGDLGINVVDTAEQYGDGEGERRVGEAIHGRRERWVVVTKFGLRRGPERKRIESAGLATIRASLEGSLDRLRTDYVDVYLYHGPPKREHIALGREALERLREQGKLRFYGISTNDSSTLRTFARHSAVEVIMFSQSLLTHPSDTLQLIRRHKLGGMVRGALERGLLTGKYFQAPPQFSFDDIRSYSMKGADYARYAVYKPFVPPGADMTAFALRYLMDFDTTHTIVLGARSIEDYRRALKAVELPRLSEEMHALLFEARKRFSRPERRIGRIVGKILASLRHRAGRS